MNIEVITSFNQHYYDLIGRDCVESWLKHWPEDLSITCYVEEMRVKEHPRIKQINFDQLSDRYTEFNENPKTKPRQKTFAKKAFSVIHAMFNSTADWIFWIDADVITKQHLNMNLLKDTLDSKYLSVYMGVCYAERRDGTKGDWLVPETGIFAVNTRHPKFDDFRSEYARRYTEHDFADLRKGYDNDVFGITIKTIDADYLDLCANFEKHYKTPLPHTVFGDYLTHHKAKHGKSTYVQERQ